MEENLTIYQVDAFAEAPFQGNPAAVCILPEPRDKSWMQAVALEMNLSETAFLVRRGDGFDLRWFTPAVEVELCGHATLASAHILWETGILKPGENARFRTASGLLTAKQKGDLIELDFPATPPEKVDPPAGLIEALGVRPEYIGRTRFDYFIEVGSEDAVRGTTPDFTSLRNMQVRGIMITSVVSSDRFDFVSRFFAPGSGIDEDPVTGSAHCCLGPYWSEKLGKTEMTAYQASSRGGIVRVSIDGERVRLGGNAVTVLRGELVGCPAS